MPFGEEIDDEMQRSRPMAHVSLLDLSPPVRMRGRAELEAMRPAVCNIDNPASIPIVMVTHSAC